MEPVTLTEEDYANMRAVTALEAWCLATATIVAITQGNKELEAAIAAMADEMHQQIMRGTDADSE